MGSASHRIGRRRIAVPVVALALALAGCLGSQPPEPSPATTPSVVVRLDPSDMESRICAYRSAHGLGPVQLDEGLMLLAQAQANAMARADHLSHEISGSLDHRLNAAHWPRGFAVENVSAGYANAPAALTGWEQSPGHNANLLDRHVHRMGIAAADAPGTRYKIYWSLIMTD